MSDLKTHLVVDAGHPAVRIEILDAEYQVQAKGYGRIEEDLPTGYYTIQYRAADAMAERDIALRPDQPVTISDPPYLPFSSAAPLAYTSTSHEYHQYSAQHLSRSAPLGLGDGSQVFVFVRDVNNGGSTHPAKGLSLHDMDGRLVVPFDEIIESSRGASEARWGGRNIAVDPGFYRLRLALRKDRSIEMIVPACPNWQSQVFLLRQGGQTEFAGRTVLDLPNAAHLMARPHEGFDPFEDVSVRRTIQPDMAGEDLRLIELARQSLALGYRGIRATDLQAMLWGKWEDPLLGILGLHLLLRQPEPDLNFASNIHERLRGILMAGFRHPDIDALALEITRRLGITIDMPPFTAPPMLRQSWSYLVEATARLPELIPPGSFLFQIAGRLWGASAWLIWEAPIDDQVRSARASEAQPVPPPPATTREEPPPPASAGPRPTAARSPGPSSEASPPPTAAETAPPGLADFPATRQAIDLLLLFADELTDQASFEKLARKAKFNEIEYALLLQFRGQFAARQRKMERPVDSLSLESLITQLGVPSEVIQAAMAGLYVKLSALLKKKLPV
jgi:hypothetical protein